MQIAKHFKVGDKVKYIGIHSTGFYHTLANKTLTVKAIHKELTTMTDQLISFEELSSNTYMNANHFMSVELLPDFKEILYDAVSEDTLSEGKDLFLYISNPRADKVGLSYTKQDLLTVLRILERYRVKADISFDAELKQSIGLCLFTAGIMEELCNDSPSTLPIEAIRELTFNYEIVAHIGSTQYFLNPNLEIYEEKDMSAVQTASEG